GGLPLGQRYLPGTMTVETRWSGLTITDWLYVHPVGNGGSQLSDNHGTALIRVLSGTARAKIELAPRPEFGQLPIRLHPLGQGLLVLGSSEPIALHSPGIEWDIVGDGGNEIARATIDLSAMGGSSVLELRLGTSNLDAHPIVAGKRQEVTEQRSQEWAASLRLPSVAREAVLRSALTLRGLCHQPPGAILAAATTSLPEELGGVRNWDYRYCWLRDAAMTARVLVDLGSLEEAEGLLGWTMRVVDATGGHPERLHPLYAVDGNELGAEAVI